MNNKEKWRERVRDVCADSTTRWWWASFYNDGFGIQLPKKVDLPLSKEDKLNLYQDSVDMVLGSDWQETNCYQVLFILYLCSPNTHTHTHIHTYIYIYIYIYIYMRMCVCVCGKTYKPKWRRLVEWKLIHHNYFTY